LRETDFAFSQIFHSLRVIDLSNNCILQFDRTKINFVITIVITDFLGQLMVITDPIIIGDLFFPCLI